MGTAPYAWSGRDGQGNVRSGTGSITTSTPATALKIIGMSAPANLWDQRVAEVGAAGLTARRIFADLTSNGRDQESLIDDAVADGLMPVVSYKLPRDGNGDYRITDALAGVFDPWVNALGNFLDSLGVQVAVIFHHEPRGDLSPSDFVALNKRFTPLVRKSADIRVGCFINGFLLDGSASAKAEFASYSDMALLNLWDWFGIDAYHGGTPTDPDPVKTPGSRIRLTADWLAARGLPDKPVGIGEYNGYTAAAIADAGEALLSEPSVWFGNVWNAQGTTSTPLTGDRLTAFKATKADPRAAQ